MQRATSVLRSLGRVAWWCAGVGPFAGMSLLLWLVALSIEERSIAWRCAGVGLAGVAITLAACWQWSRPAVRGLAELPRCLLLAVPPSYLPTLLALQLTRTPDLASLELLVVPRSAGVWASVYFACLVLVWLVRQPPTEGGPDGL